MTTRSKQPTGYTCDCGKVHAATATWPKRWWTMDLEHFCAKCGRSNNLKNGRLAMPEKFRH